MSLFKKYRVWLISSLMLWGLISLLVYIKDAENVLFLRGFFFSSLIVSTLYFIQSRLIPKLSGFSITKQIFLKTILYIISVLSVGSLVFVIFAFYSLSNELVIGEIIVQFSKAVMLILLSPFTEVTTGDLIPEKVQYLFYIVVFSFTFIGLGSVLISFIQTHWSHERHVAQINEAQIKMLQAQIQPHFLFNTLNTIVSVVRQNPAQAEDLLLKFSDFYRFSFSTGHNKSILIQDEIKFIANYLNLLKARFGNYLKWKIELDDACKQIEIPVMILQPIVENAIKHGWQEKKQNFEITVGCLKKTKYFEIEIKDNGTGFDLKDEKRFPPKGHGLDSIQQRLKLFYGQKELIQFKSQVRKGTTITLNIPV